MSSDPQNNSNSTVLTQDGKGQLIQVGVEHIKNAYIVDGCSSEELAIRFHLPVATIDKLIADSQLDKLRAAHIKHGLAKLQNIQLVQAEKLMDIETQFKRIRIIQLEKSLEDYLAYYSRHGHFYKVHPITQEILIDTNGIPIQIKIPNVSHEIAQLKESVSLSEGLKQLLSQIDDIIHRPKDLDKMTPDIIDVTNYDSLFKKRSLEDED